ncbi:DUF4255 domain-containing protein [Leptolyngbya sp. FACHB-16]|uniref:DUF4255 domain-containing protein n=1 Tax=unclassified Leptolyngbya TaxID=2650499 RepID=UPI00168329C5|nr:DUF4255 domain-containing protein [Leptolyngbya sp. FACHB-16]MBD2158522.1 DUF4255 domain-containing protein [Leptolyngbya sp. FACHB-16]
MSSALAIGAVSAVIKNLLENGLIRRGIASSLGDSPTITMLAPELDGSNAGALAKSRLNLFLYQTTPNLGWRNMGLPSRDSRGEELTNPPLALDLHYLLTAYSREAFHAEIMLGYAMQLLHEFPVLTRGGIRSALESLASSDSAAERALATSELADQIEQIKISPQSMNTEEISKLWSALQSQYRPTVVYQASVVLIEGHRPTKSALPVRDRNLITLPFNRPVIETISPQMILAGETLTIQGQNLKAELVQVSFGMEAGVPQNPANVTNTQIQVPLPAGLRAGVNTVQIVHPLDFGTGSYSEPHRGVESNIVAFVLAPKIIPSSQSSPTVLQASQGSTLTLSVEPPVGRKQRVALLIGDRVIAIPSRSATGSESTSDLSFPIPIDFPLGIFLMRLRVDGAESVLEVDTKLDSPTFNQYIGPKLEIT